MHYFSGKGCFEFLESMHYCIGILKREVSYGNSRFDLYIETEERKIFMEVKGVTLEENGVVRFPDAPTKRGVKHIKV